MNRRSFVVSVLAVLLLIALAAFAQKGEYADFEGNKIYFVDSGGKKKEALVFIHGWTCNSDFWEGSIHAFPGRRVIAIDLIGHGKSDKPKDVYSMDYFARSVEVVLKKAKVDHAVLVGHSMGTPVARQFYRRNPQRTLAIVIVDGGVTPFAPEDVMKGYAAPLRADYAKNAPQFMDSLTAAITNEDLKKRVRDSMLSTPGYVAVSAWDGMADAKVWTDDKIDVPVLALMAPSQFWPPNVKDIFVSVAPNVDFQMWTGVSHFLMMEKPKEFNEAVAAFLSKNKLL